MWLQLTPGTYPRVRHKGAMLPEKVVSPRSHRTPLNWSMAVASKRMGALASRSAQPEQVTTGETEKRSSKSHLWYRDTVHIPVPAPAVSSPCCSPKERGLSTRPEWGGRIKRSKDQGPLPYQSYPDQHGQRGRGKLYPQGLLPARFCL